MDARTLRALLVATLAGALFLPATPVRAFAPDEPARTDGIVDLDALVVSGAQPGPGLWKVEKDGHALYILGTVSPLPRRMEWMSGEVEAVVARSGVVIAPPAMAVDAGVGFFRGMTLLPAALGARNNPGKRRLREVVPPDQYARWEVLKARYIGRDRGVEKRRPLLAAQALYDAALDRSGLRTSGVVWPVVRKAAKDADVTVVDSTVRVRIENPRAVLKDLAARDLADGRCFEGTMHRIETDLDAMRARANAWATGDLEALRALPVENHFATCLEALTGDALAAELGLDDLQARAGAAWLENAEAALTAHPTSFAVLPMGHMLGEDGLLATLAARGYRIEAP